MYLCCSSAFLHDCRCWMYLALEKMAYPAKNSPSPPKRRLQSLNLWFGLQGGYAIPDHPIQSQLHQQLLSRISCVLKLPAKDQPAYVSNIKQLYSKESIVMWSWIHFAFCVALIQTMCSSFMENNCVSAVLLCILTQQQRTYDPTTTEPELQSIQIMMGSPNRTNSPTSRTHFELL